MPALPTVNVTDAQSNRILEAFKALFGTTTTAETVTAYRRWVASNVRQIVLSHESSKLETEYESKKSAALVALEATLPRIEDIV